MENDWREILSLSQNELNEFDKDRLCEKLAWMEPDDIELNFADLKALFRLSQDILKYKTEQVNGLMGKLETIQRKGKSKKKNINVESADTNSDEIQHRITRQEEKIRKNKEILAQLHRDIAELKENKREIKNDMTKTDVDSESSRNTLSDINTIAQLEADIIKRNRHIRKLQADINLLEEENTNVKNKLSTLNSKLKESTLIIENLTEQLVIINKENSQFKDMLGTIEKEKTDLEIEALKKENEENDYRSSKFEDSLKSKVQQLKNLLKSHKNEIQRLSNENYELKEDIHQKSISSPIKQTDEPDYKVKELQEKLLEASEEILRSANLIEILKSENRQLKTTVVIEESNTIESNYKNESDDGKERTIINNLNKKIRKLTTALQGSEEMIRIREQEIAEITSQLQLLQTDEGINALIKGIKDKRRALKIKDEGIKSLVSEVNNLNEVLNQTQLENESMREQLDIPIGKKIATQGILKKYREMETNIIELTKNLQLAENKIINLEIDKDSEKSKHDSAHHKKSGQDEYNNINENTIAEERIPNQIEALTIENEGLRNGLTEILNFLKDNSTTTSGVLALECPSLDALLQSMQARRLAGWFSPHMSTIMELRTAIGSRDALLTALHESRKETYEVISKLTNEKSKCLELETQLSEIKAKSEIRKDVEDKICSTDDFNFCQIGSWIGDDEYNNLDIINKIDICNVINKGNTLFENQLKNSLLYFQNKFMSLFNEFTSLEVVLADNKNKWSVDEENYKAQIESLKQQIQENEDEESTDNSPGRVNIPNTSSLIRRCSYLEDMYKQIRTSNENIKNEYLESKKERMLLTSEYESKTNNLLLSIIKLTDKLRNTIPVNLFMRQNEYLNEIILKYRNITEKSVNRFIESTDLVNRLDRDKIDLISRLHQQIKNGNAKDSTNTTLSMIEQSIVHSQLKQVLTELENKSKEVEMLRNEINSLQEFQAKLLDNIQFTEQFNDTNNLKEQVKLLKEENKSIKEKFEHMSGQLDIALLQLGANEQKYLCNDIELNMLKHQILDLQCSGNNKSIIARLGGEILLAQLQASESLQAIDILKIELNRERQLRTDVEIKFMDYQKISELNTVKYESKIRGLYGEINLLRQEYQGSVPFLSIENFFLALEDLYKKRYDVNEKLNEVEDLRSNFIRKNTAYQQILDLYQNKCSDDVENCPHKMQNIINESLQSTELKHYREQLKTVENSYKDLRNRYCDLEKKLQSINQTFNSDFNNILKTADVKQFIPELLQLEDIHSDDESSNGNETYTVSKNKEKNPIISDEDNKVQKREDIAVTNDTRIKENKLVQTDTVNNNSVKDTQTDSDKHVIELTANINNLISENTKLEKLLSNHKSISQHQSQEILNLKLEKNELETKSKFLSDSVNHKDNHNRTLQLTIENFRKQLDDLKANQRQNLNERKFTELEENQVLINNLKKNDSDKNTVLLEYKALLKNEREKFVKCTKDFQAKIIELQTKLDNKENNEDTPDATVVPTACKEYTLKIIELEDKCFKLEREMEQYTNDLKISHDELERWKELAAERLTKMEQLKMQLKDRHKDEIESYKTENQHWMTQLNETQREYTELRSRFAEQRAQHLKQLAEKDSMIEQQRFMTNNLKTQIINMQSMFSINDPSFDLSAIVEVEEASDGVSQQDSEKLELKFDSTIDLIENQDGILKIPNTSTMVWQEPLIERLRREKQLISKQNSLLRRQIKALAGRERRARLDAQNLKNQVFRISTNGSKVPSAESTALQTKIASLQAQLNSARSEGQSNVALWDKWKRSQQASERWQVKYEEKCQEVKKLDSSLQLAKSTVCRLEKEKRILLTRLSELKQEKQIVEKQEEEKSEKLVCFSDECSAPPVSAAVLLARVAAQQRRIVALEVAEKGNEPLVLEYEKALAEITSLKGQVLKLESTLLESQIRSPMTPTEDHEPELKYWKNYCDMLKEENMQLTLKLNSYESGPTTAHRQRLGDLEQTVLTLRGLVCKLQAEQKSSTTHRRQEPGGSGLGAADKTRNHADTSRVEIVNLKRSLQEKDLLLEKSKEMLKMAAEREEELLRENTSLCQRLRAITDSVGGPSSA